MPMMNVEPGKNRAFSKNLVPSYVVCVVRVMCVVRRGVSACCVVRVMCVCVSVVCVCVVQLQEKVRRTWGWW
jgi:hypothetical protein